MAARTDERAERVIGGLLRGGVIASVAVVVAGGVFYLIHHGAETPAWGQFRGEPYDLRSVGGIVAGAVTLRARDLVQLGLVMLMATPVARVAFSVFAFAAQKDRTYVVVTLVVLAILLASIAGVI